MAEVAETLAYPAIFPINDTRTFADVVDWFGQGLGTRIEEGVGTKKEAS